MNGAELIELAGHHVEYEVSTVLEACEVFYMNGLTDAVSGDVESNVGHFYRVNRWIVQTDSQGFHHLSEKDHEAEAIAAFYSLNAMYSSWLGKEDDESADVGNPQ